MKTKNLAVSLQRYGIRAANYRKPPLGKDVFALTIRPSHKEGVVTVHQGKARVDVTGSKKQRQAAVTVREKGRVVTRGVSTKVDLNSPGFHDNTRLRTAKELKPTEAWALSKLREAFPVVMPGEAKWKVRNVTAKRIKERGRHWSKQGWMLSGIVTAHVHNGTVNHFLIGMDETHHFVAPLPAKATSVAHAHKLLRPEGLNKKALRQGEWFFEPCNKVKCRQLDKHIPSMKKIRLEGRTHIAMSAVTIHEQNHRNVIYARGFIVDDRKGHHKHLNLKNWHKVVRNKEATIKVNPDQQKRAARRQNTYD